jgi:hypothetical protein
MIIEKKKVLATAVIKARGQKAHMDEASKLFIDNKLQLIMDNRVHSFPLVLETGSVKQMLYQIKIEPDFCIKFMLENNQLLLIWLPRRETRNMLQHTQYIKETILNDEDIKKFMQHQTMLKQLSDEHKITGKEAPKYAY